jgi:hypothetical protein
MNAKSLLFSAVARAEVSEASPRVRLIEPFECCPGFGATCAKVTSEDACDALILAKMPRTAPSASDLTPEQPERGVDVLVLGCEGHSLAPAKHHGGGEFLLCELAELDEACGVTDEPSFVAFWSTMPDSHVLLPEAGRTLEIDLALVPVAGPDYVRDSKLSACQAVRQ